MLLASLHKEDIGISYFLFSGYLEFKNIEKRSEVKSIRVKIKKKKTAENLHTGILILLRHTKD